MSKRRSLKQIKADRLMEEVYSVFLRTGWPEALITQSQGGWSTGCQSLLGQVHFNPGRKWNGLGGRHDLGRTWNEMQLLAALNDYQPVVRQELLLFLCQSRNDHKTMVQCVWVQMLRKMNSRWNLQYAFVAIVWSAYYGKLFKDGVTPCPLCWSDATGSQSAESCNTAERGRIHWEDMSSTGGKSGTFQLSLESLTAEYVIRCLFG